MKKLLDSLFGGFWCLEQLGRPVSTDIDTAANPAAEEEKQPLDLQVDVKEVSACERHVTVTIPRSEIDRYFQKQFDELAPMAEVPGFRTGKAPRRLIESRFKPQVSDQVKGSLIMDSLTQIGDTQDYSAISEPDLDFELVNVPDEGDMTYEFDIEVRPEFDMPDWKGLSLDRPEHEFNDADIEDHISKLAVQFSDLAPVEEAVKAEDFIVCDIVSKHDGKVVSKLTEQSIQVRPILSLSDATIEDFGKLVTGAKAGDSKTTSVDISEYSENEELKGKKVDVEISIHDVKRVEAKTAAEVAEKLGIDSEGELKDLIKESLESQLQYAQRERIRDQISASLTESADWELPPDLLRRQSRRELDRNVMELRSSGFSEDEIVARENGLRKNILERTERLLKEHFILEKIAEAETVEDVPEDYDQEILRLAAQQNDSPRRVRARLERSGQMDALRNMIIERKVIDVITEHAKFKATKYDAHRKETTSAINFFVAGGSSEEIPEAKYDDAGMEQALPNANKKERD